MLAVSFHSNSNPQLGTGTCFFPVGVSTKSRLKTILRVQKSQTQNIHGRGTRLNYVTLVQLPDNHCVAFLPDCHSIPTELRPTLLSQLHVEVRQALHQWFGDPISDGAPVARNDKLSFPAFVLSDPLPPKAVKWTKDARLLLRKPRPE
jgi:hypothetical protein